MQAGWSFSFGPLPQDDTLCCVSIGNQAFDLGDPPDVLAEDKVLDRH
jgi:hypothetical protein